MLVNLQGDAPFFIKHTCDLHPVQENFPMHAHSHYEILIFISGDITYLVEGNAYTPRPWDMLLFNIAETHKVVLRADAPYERLAIQMHKEIFAEILPAENLFAPFHAGGPGGNNLLRPTDFRDDLWKRCARRLQEAEGRDSMTALSWLLPLLCEIRHAFLHREASEEETSLSAQIVQYVNRHITEDISPTRLTQTFLISRSALYTLFHRATGTGIHDYVNVKRLILAQELLRRGEKPMKVYERVGFREYTTFFRAYKKLFGIPPKADGGDWPNRQT